MIFSTLKGCLEHEVGHQNMGFFLSFTLFVKKHFGGSMMYFILKIIFKKPAKGKDGN